MSYMGSSGWRGSRPARHRLSSVSYMGKRGIDDPLMRKGSPGRRRLSYMAIAMSYMDEASDQAEGTWSLLQEVSCDRPRKLAPDRRGGWCLPCHGEGTTCRRS